MRRNRLRWAASTLAVALALAGCATGRRGDPAVATECAPDAPSSVIADTPLPQPEDPSALRVLARGDPHLDHPLGGRPRLLYTEIEPRRWTLGARRRPSGRS